MPVISTAASMADTPNKTPVLYRRVTTRQLQPICFLPAQLLTTTAANVKRNLIKTGRGIGRQLTRNGGLVRLARNVAPKKQYCLTTKLYCFARKQ